jgi:transcriptional regulator with XRE-family HTH domain
MYIRFRLKALMDARGLSEADLWKRTKVARNTIRALMRNASTRVDLGTLEKLAEGLGVRPLELLEETEQSRGNRRPALLKAA